MRVAKKSITNKRNDLERNRTSTPIGNRQYNNTWYYYFGFHKNQRSILPMIKPDEDLIKEKQILPTVLYLHLRCGWDLNPRTQKGTDLKSVAFNQLRYRIEKNN